MRMLASRTRTRPTNSRPTSPRSCVPVPAVSRAVLSPVVSLKLPPLALREGPDLRGRLDDLLLLRVPLEARLGLEVAVNRVGRDEDEPRVGLGRPRDPAGDLVQVELHDREEALQIRLLVYGEVYVPGLHELQDLRQEVVPASLDSLVVQSELLHHLGYALRAPRVHGEHAGHVLMPVVPGLYTTTLIRQLGARGDLLNLDVGPGILYGLLRAVYARLDVELSRRRYEERHQTLPDEVDDPVPHLHAGLEEVLPDVSQRGIGPRPLAVGVVGDDRDTLVEGLLDRVVERNRVHHRHRYAVGVARDGRVHRVHHLPDDRLLRARPLRRRPQQRLRGLDAVLRRHEERICSYVVDEDEVPLRRVREVAAGPTGTTATLARLLRLRPAPAQ